MELSVVIPCYNEYMSLEELHTKLTSELKSRKIKYELIMVDDGSLDDTFKVLKELHNIDKNIKIISFSRNFGKEAAMFAGLKEARGKYVSIMDSDLQHDAKRLIEMYDKLIENSDFDIVCAYQENNDYSKIRKTLTSLFYRINNRISNVKMLPGAGDFRVFKKSVCDAIISLEEQNRFLKGIFSWIGFNTIYVPYTPEKREYGKTKWSLLKLIKYSVGGLISFSTKPLKFTMFVGSFFLILGLINFFLLGELSHRTIILMLSIIMFEIGIISIYLVRIYNNVLKRPVYIIKEKIDN